MEKVSLYDHKSMELWDDFVESHPGGTPYHLSGWLKTIHQTYGFDPILYVNRNETELASVFPIFKLKKIFAKPHLVSLPFSDYGGPLAVDNSKFDNAKEILSKYKNTSKRIEIREALEKDCGYICYDYYKYHALDIGRDKEEIKKGINKKTIQYSIRKARKAGIEIEEDNSLTGINEFYRLNLMTRKKHGVPAQPKRFIKTIHEQIIQKQMGFILLAKYHSSVVAASVFMKSGNTIHYKFNASDPSYLGKITPNHLLTWESIKKGNSEGFKVLDFGRTSPDNKGLIRYKEMWGMKGKDLPYFYYPKVMGAASTSENSLNYKMLTGVWNSIPSLITDRLSPIIYKYLA